MYNSVMSVRAGGLNWNDAMRKYQIAPGRSEAVFAGPHSDAR
jgi:hypothetical protein